MIITKTVTLYLVTDAVSEIVVVASSTPMEDARLSDNATYLPIDTREVQFEVTEDACNFLTSMEMEALRQLPSSSDYLIDQAKEKIQ